VAARSGAQSGQPTEAGVSDNKRGVRGSEEGSEGEREFPWEQVQRIQEEPASRCGQDPSLSPLRSLKEPTLDSVPRKRRRGEREGGGEGKQEG